MKELPMTNTPITSEEAVNNGLYEALEEQLWAVANAGFWGISHVGAANYREREAEALKRLNTALSQALAATAHLVEPEQTGGSDASSD